MRNENPYRPHGVVSEPAVGAALGMRALMLAAMCFIAASQTLADESTCRTVRGRMFLSNGTPSVRIWIVGTHRVLGVIQQDESFGDLPANIRQLWDSHGDIAMCSTYLFGDF